MNRLTLENITKVFTERKSVAERFFTCLCILFTFELLAEIFSKRGRLIPVIESEVRFLIG